MSVDDAALWGVGIAVTLTTRDTPGSSEDWKRALDALTAQWRRWGLVRHHMVTEWQKRGAPHLHAAVYFDPAAASVQLGGGEWPHGPMEPDDWRSRHQVAAQLLAVRTRRVWTERLAAAWGAGSSAQHVVEVMNADRWAQYLSKHAARGSDHYQRQRDTLPASWHTTGRLWSKGGAWPTREDVFDTDLVTYHRLRRWVRRWQWARARRQVQLGELHQNARQLRAGERELAALGRVGRGSPEFSAVRGISVHLRQHWTQRLLDLAADHAEARVKRRDPPPKPAARPKPWPSCPWPRPAPPRPPLGPLSRALVEMAKLGPRSGSWSHYAAAQGVS